MMSDQNRQPHLLIVDDDPRVIDFYREALALPHTQAEQVADQELDDMFALLEGEEESQSLEQTSHCQVVIANQGLEALRIFAEMEEAGTPFDLALLDMRIPPGIDGLEVALDLRSKQPNLPILFFTAYSDYKEEYLQQQMGGNYRLLRKPISHELLRTEVQQLLPDHLCFD